MPDPTQKKVPINVITGFLGVGKTTAIRHLLKNKPTNERWAVLVNEFGEVGIDGALMNADGIAVKEVTGGCICCSVRTPSREALVNLINEQHPDRVLIEPTGLALPKKILNMFASPALQAMTEPQAVVCLVDPWCFSSDEFLKMPVFAEQIHMADVVLANKADVASEEALASFKRYMLTVNEGQTEFNAISQGVFDWTVLQTPHQPMKNAPTIYEHNTGEKSAAPLPEADAEGVIRVENRTQFGFSCGWTFSNAWQFDGEELMALIESLPIPRIKGIFATQAGWTVINKMRQTVSSELVDIASDSRVEMINLEATDWQALDEQIRACRVFNQD